MDAYDYAGVPGFLEFDVQASFHTRPQAGLSLSEADDEAVITITAIEHLDGLWIRRNGETIRIDDDPSVGETYTISTDADDEIVVVGVYGGTESVLLEHVASGY